ncbi:MAG: hypothetical protein OXG84_00070 [Chloroflexi bacterium]|nr:hypothetical protein [Chloroflexota bacterium]
MVTQDIRFERIDMEYLSLRGSQDRLMKKVDDSESAILGLTEAVVDNRKLILENREMLLAIIKHLEVPYDKPPMGFDPEKRD